MKRLGVVLAMGLLWGALPARASGSVTGEVQLPTFASPAAARLAYWTDPDSNGVLGSVFRLATGSRSFVLRLTGGATGLEDVDITFYASIEGVSPATGSFANTGDEAGDIPAGSQWAVVTLSAGLEASFRYTWS